MAPTPADPLDQNVNRREVRHDGIKVEIKALFGDLCCYHYPAPATVRLSVFAGDCLEVRFDPPPVFGQETRMIQDRSREPLVRGLPEDNLLRLHS